MFIDADTAEDGSVFVGDVCIIGAGAAGITLARELGAAGLDVCLLESGGIDPELETEKLSLGTNAGDPYPLEGSRVRRFGGSTNHWGGLSGTLEAADFTQRPWIKHSGWPITLNDLEPYYGRALGILDIPRRYSFAELERDVELYPRLLGPDSKTFEPVLRLQSPPTRMGVKYMEEIARSARIRCYLHANAIELVPGEHGRTVERLSAATLKGRRFTFRARHYALCTGGVENARILLLSNSVVKTGLGNDNDLVGRFFMDHFNLGVGEMIVAPPPGAKGFQESHVHSRALSSGLSGVADWITIATTPQARARLKLLGYSVNIPQLHQPDPGDSDVAELVTNPTGQPTNVAPSPAAQRYPLFVFAEQAPNPNSRVLLSGEKDALGCRKIAIAWHPLPEDLRSIRQSSEQFALDVAQAGHGRVKLDELAGPWLGGGGHHQGTTRMADDPKRGVTDRHGKVHGIANLHVAGGSLFPTGGFMSPTLTIVALALRLADRLRVLGSEPAAQTDSRGP